MPTASLRMTEDPSCLLDDPMGQPTATIGAADDIAAAFAEEAERDVAAAAAAGDGEAGLATAEPEFPPPPLLKLVGVGGAGVNVASRLSASGLAGCSDLSLAVMDCDARQLEASPVAETWLLGERERRGLSAGGEVDLGRQAAEASRESLASASGGADLLFLVAGLGGGTASAAAPLLAAEASKAGGLVIGFALLPFSFEGGRRVKQAEAALLALRRACDAVIVLPNDLLLQETREGASALAAFAQADEWIARAVRALCGLLCKTGLMNVDFAALQRAFEYRGSKTVFGLGQSASGDGEGALSDVERAKAILQSLHDCPFRHAPETARRADRLLVSLAGGPAVLTLALLNTVAQAVGEEFGKSAELIVGATLDDTLGERVELCLIGTSDIGTSSRRSVTSAIHAPATGKTRNTPSPLRGGQEERVAPSPQAKKEQRSADTSQTEFGFSAAVERGHFQKAEATIFEGENLDVPTYQRRGVKIAQ